MLEGLFLAKTIAAKQMRLEAIHNTVCDCVIDYIRKRLGQNVVPAALTCSL